jgi:hypothetical protein
MRNSLLIFASALVSAAVPIVSPRPAEAQTPQPPSVSPPASSQAPSTKPDAKPKDPLSEKLDKNEGVLEPPSGVDPGMHKKPPADTGDKMPVIVPPGEPGGDQSVQPK